MRSGRHFKFTPEVLQKKINEYFEWADNNPIIKTDVIRNGDKAGQVLEIPINRPYTIQELCRFIGINSATWRNWIRKRELEKYIEEGDNGKIEQIEQLFVIISDTKDIIAGQQLAGATAGIYNPMIVARMNSLTDKQEIDVKNLDAKNRTDDEIQAAIIAIEEARKHRAIENN